MEYKVQTAYFLGDVVPLEKVAESMALLKAASFGYAEFRDKAFDEAIVAYRALLLREAKGGRLVVTDSSGIDAPANDLIDKAKSNGLFIDAGYRLADHLLKALPKSPDELSSAALAELSLESDDALSEVLCLYTKMKFLNDWGASRGDSFVLLPDSGHWWETGKIHCWTQPKIDKTWQEKAVDAANRIGQERWAKGDRNISARSVCDAVAAELSLDPTTYSNRKKPREPNSIRIDALSEWEFQAKPA